MKINFKALGCRLNEAELENWSNEFLLKGHELTNDSDKADLIIFNSCSVTSEADRKSRNLINRIQQANPHSQLVVTGCYATLQQQQVEKKLGVDLVIPNQKKDQLVELVTEKFSITDPSNQSIDQHSLFDRGRHRAFIKVQDGCRYRCTFCIVTVARGEEQSRLQKDIIQDINRQYEQGVQEVIITGVHVGGYGSDIGSNLYELLSEILNKTDIPRIRLASVEPWDLPDNFFDLFKDSRLMPHMHLPLQSGSDSVLRRMARRCKTAEYETIVEKARDVNPLFNITTDLIVGFPGETDQEWQQSIEFVQKVGFGHMHIFTYSQRQGTKAARLPGQLSKAIKKERSRDMHLIAKKLKTEALQQLVGNTVEVLWESHATHDPTIRVGYTTQYHKIKAKRCSLTGSNISQISVKALDTENLLLVGEE